MGGPSGDYSRFQNVHDGFIQAASNTAKNDKLSNRLAIRTEVDKLSPEELVVLRKIIAFVGANKPEAMNLNNREVILLQDLENRYGAKGNQEHLTSSRKEGAPPLYKQIARTSRESLPVSDSSQTTELQSRAPKEPARTRADIEKMGYFSKDIQQKLHSEGVLKNAMAAMGEKASELKKDIRLLQNEVKKLEYTGVLTKDALKAVSKDYATTFFGKDSPLSSEEKENYLSKLIIGLQPRKAAQASGRSEEPPLQSGIGSR